MNPPPRSHSAPACGHMPDPPTERRPGCGRRHEFETEYDPSPPTPEEVA